MSASYPAQTDLAFRQASADDWPRVAEMVKDSWDDGDYIDESIWRGWASGERAGRLEAGTLGGTIVSFAHLTELGPAEWWLEGVRVARDQRGKGYGRATLAHMLEVFAEIGYGLLRFSTGSQNEVMSHLAEGFGFHSLISYAPMEAPAMPVDYRNFRVLQSHNLDIAYHYLRRSPIARVNHFAEHHWTLYYMTQERLSHYLASPDMQVLGWRQLEQLNGLAVIYPSDPQSSVMRLGYLDAPDDTIALAMMGAIQGIAARRGFTSISWKMPLGLGLERRLASTQFSRRRDYDLTLFEKPLRG